MNEDSMMSQTRPRVDPDGDDVREARESRIETTMNIWDGKKSVPDPEPASSDIVAADFNAHYRGFLYLILVSPKDAANAASRGVKLPIGQNVWLFDTETNQRVRAKVKERLPDNRGVVMSAYWGTIEACREAPDLLPEKVKGTSKPNETSP
jgi:hypothetical protein